jgi:hypothetical protein
MVHSIPSIAHEFTDIDLPDERLKRRAQAMLETLYKSPNKSLPATFGGRAELKAAYRFFDQESVTSEAILRPHIEKTIHRMEKHPTVLIVNDTTDINMSHMEQVESLGVLNDTNSPGCLLHVLKAFTPERLPLGVLSAKFITRSPASLGVNKKRSTPIEEKESYRWLQDYRTACDVAKNLSTHVVYIADREADIFELFYEAKSGAADLVIRGNYDRNVLQEDGTIGHLLPLLAQSHSIGTLNFTLPVVNNRLRKKHKQRDTKGRAGRQVHQEVKSLEVTITPIKEKRQQYSPVTVHALYLTEIGYPAEEEPINWLLLTTIKIESFEDAQKVVNFYLGRWGIETFFHVLKTGCQVEELQFHDSLTKSH